MNLNGQALTFSTATCDKANKVTQVESNHMKPSFNLSKKFGT